MSSREANAFLMSTSSEGQTKPSLHLKNYEKTRQASVSTSLRCHTVFFPSPSLLSSPNKEPSSQQPHHYRQTWEPILVTLFCGFFCSGSLPGPWPFSPVACGFSFSPLKVHRSRDALRIGLALVPHFTLLSYQQLTPSSLSINEKHALASSKIATIVWSATLPGHERWGKPFSVARRVVPSRRHSVGRHLDD